RPAKLKKNGGVFEVQWLKEAPLPEGLVQDSFTEPNLGNISEFAAAIRGLLDGNTRGSRLAVALPDYVARVQVLDFDSAPKKGDTAQMLKWRLKKVLPFEIDLATLRWQYLGRFTVNEKGQHRYLTSIIKTEILSQYQTALALAGVNAKWLGIASFSVWNLFRSNVVRELGEEADFAVMNLSAGKLSVIIFSKGSPHFMRLKDLGKLGNSEDGPMDVIRILRELNASLVYYKENFSSAPVRTVYLTGDAGGMETLAKDAVSKSGIDARVFSLKSAVQPGAVTNLPVCFSAACGAASEI
ncbi:MAG: type IV pilus biogenesis protein PilM, partial [Nitrospirota bacterium]